MPCRALWYVEEGVSVVAHENSPVEFILTTNGL